MSTTKRVVQSESSGLPNADGRGNAKIPPEIIAMLGTQSDSDLARKCGLSRSTIRHARLARGIELHKDGYHLPEEILNQLGTMRDCQLARIAGRAESTIRSARERRGIPKFLAPRHHSLESGSSKINRAGAISRTASKYVSLSSLKADQLDELKAKLPYCTITSLSRSTGISPHVLTTLRKKLKIPSSELRYEPSPELLACLGKQPDTTVAKAFKVKPKWVRKVRRIYSIPKFDPLHGYLERYKPLLGKVSDRFLERHFGHAKSTIRELRERLGIAPYQQRGEHSGKPSDEVMQLLEQLDSHSGDIDQATAATRGVDSNNAA